MAKGRELIETGIRTNLTGNCRKAYRKTHLDEAFRYIREAAAEPKDFKGGPIYSWIDLQIAIERAFQAGFNAAS